MSYSMDSSGDNCYPNTTVLINKLGIRDQAVLTDTEQTLASLHSIEIENNPPSDPFTFDFYCGLHRQLFSDLYDWAGQLRTVDISKQATRFYPARDLQAMGDAKFAYLQEMQEFSKLSRSEFIDEITDFYHELNMLHPFREGNGRTQRLFFTLLIRRAGYDIRFSDCDLSQLMVATIYAAQGVIDYLRAFFENAILS